MSARSRSVLTLLGGCAAALSHRTTTATRCKATWTSATRTVASLRLSGRFQSVERTTRRLLCSNKAPCEDEYPPLPAYRADAAPAKRKEVYIVQVIGLPWSCTALDLVHFFSDCRIRDGPSGVHLTADHQGRPSGRAFVEMEHEEDVSKALEKHRQYLGPRYVEVYEVTNVDAEGLLKKAAPLAPDSRAVRLRGLPFACTEDDIRRFFGGTAAADGGVRVPGRRAGLTSAAGGVFSGLELAENGVAMAIDSRGRRTGEAVVRFSSREAADAALLRDRELIGNRYIEVFPSSGRELHSKWRKPSQSAHETPTGKRAGLAADKPAAASVPPASPNRSHQVHLRGLPFHVTGEDVVKFFAPLAVSRIRLDLGPDGRPSGEADVYFAGHGDAVAAMSKDRMYIGDRYIELFLNSVPDDER